MKAFWPSSLPSARSANVSSGDGGERSAGVAWWRGHTRDHDGDIALRLRLALVDVAKLFEVHGPTLFLAGGVLDLKLEDTIGLRASVS